MAGFDRLRLRHPEARGGQTLPSAVIGWLEARGGQTLPSRGYWLALAAGPFLAGPFPRRGALS